MRRLSRLCCAVTILGLATATTGMSQGRSQADTVGVSRRTSGRSDPSYSGIEKDFTVGKSVYLRSSKTLIGTIIAIDPDHSFPRTFNRPRSKALQIKRKDGPVDWIPVDGALRIYVVK